MRKGGRMIMIMHHPWCLLPTHHCMQATEESCLSCSWHPQTQTCAVAAPQIGNGLYPQQWWELCLEMMAQVVHSHQPPCQARPCPLPRNPRRLPPSVEWGLSNRSSGMKQKLWNDYPFQEPTENLRTVIRSTFEQVTQQQLRNCEQQQMQIKEAY